MLIDGSIDYMMSLRGWFCLWQILMTYHQSKAFRCFVSMGCPIARAKAPQWKDFMLAMPRKPDNTKQRVFKVLVICNFIENYSLMDNFIRAVVNDFAPHPIHYGKYNINQNVFFRCLFCLHTFFCFVL